VPPVKKLLMLIGLASLIAAGVFAAQKLRSA
jgi:hypothetical protein